MQDNLRALIECATSSAERRVTKDCIVRLSGSLVNWDFYDSVSLEIAQEYQAGGLSFEICDGIMNDLWPMVVEGLMLSGEHELPCPFYEIYEAFDAGEYHRKADRSDDPVELYTKPMIEELLLHYLPPDDPIARQLRANSKAAKFAG